MKVLISLLLFSLYSVSGYCQDTLTAKKDSLLMIWEDMTLPDTIRLEALYQLNVTGLNHMDNTGLDKELVITLIDSGHSAGSDYYEALGTNMLGLIYQNLGKLDSALVLYTKALNLAERADDPIAIMKIRGNMASTHIMMGKLKDALESLRESEKIIMSSDKYEADQLGQIYNTLTLFYYSIDDWENTLMYARKTVEYTENEFQNIGNHYNLGFALTMTEEYDEAIESFNRALNLCFKHNRTGLLKAGSLIGLAKVYATRNDLEIAQQYIRSANEIMKDEPLTMGSVSILIDELDTYVDLGFNEKSYQLAKKLYSFPDLNGIPLYRKKVTEVLFKHYRSTGAQQKALGLLDEYLEATEQLNKAEAEKEVLRNKLQLDYEKKELSDSLKQVRARAALQADHQQELYSKKRNQNIALGAGLFIALLAIGLYSRVRTMGRMNKKNDELLLNILPHNVAAELKHRGTTEAKNIEVATILFTDFVCFTEFSDQIRGGELVEELNHYFSSFDKIIQKYGIEKIKTIGDAYMAAGGVPTPVTGSVRNTVMAALEMQEVVEHRRQSSRDRNIPVLEMRIGIHSGPVTAGVVGVSKFQYDIWGNTVNVAARMETACEPGKVNISQRTYELIKDDPELTFEQRGKVSVKGKGEVEMYFCTRA